MSPESEATANPSNASQHRFRVKCWLQISIYIVLILLGQSTATLLGRSYYDRGGKSKWLATLVQVAGFPVLFPLYYILPMEKTLTVTDNRPLNLPSPFKAASLYIFFGLFMATLCMLYSIGLQYLPVSTFSLISASQLAFNALFSFFFNSQKLTPYIVNSLVLLTMSSTLLVFNTDSSSLLKGVSKGKYVFGFICAIANSAGYGLSLSLTQLAFDRVLKSESLFKAVLDMTVYESFVASCVTVVGLFASGEWKTLKTEMDHFELGRLSYLMDLIWTALTWQVYTFGLNGLIVKVSSLFSNIIATFGLPIVPVLAVILFHDTMNGIKVVALLLAIWGSVSYAYQEYLDHCKTKT